MKVSSEMRGLRRSRPPFCPAPPPAQRNTEPFLRRLSQQIPGRRRRPRRLLPPQLRQLPKRQPANARCCKTSSGFSEYSSTRPTSPKPLATQSGSSSANLVGCLPAQSCVGWTLFCSLARVQKLAFRMHCFNRLSKSTTFQALKRTAPGPPWPFRLQRGEPLGSDGRRCQ